MSIRESIFNEAKEILNKENAVQLELFTGFGKTKLTLDLLEGTINKRILILVPFISLKQTWIDEVKKYESNLFKDNSVDLYCYTSHKKLKDKEYDVIIFDEAHHININNNHLLTKNSKKILLSATMNEKYFTVIKADINDGLSENILPQFELKIIDCDLSNKVFYKEVYDKKTKSKKKVATSEYKEYFYHNNQFLISQRYLYAKKINPLKGNSKDPMCFKYLNSMRKRKDIIYNSINKYEKFLKNIKEELINYPSLRAIVFASNIEMADKIAKELSCSVYHSKNKSGLNEFNSKSSNILVSVNALDEGVNLVDVDMGFIIQTYFVERRFIQRQGRILRKSNNNIPKKLYVYRLLNTQDEKYVDSNIV